MSKIINFGASVDIKDELSTPGKYDGGVIKKDYIFILKFTYNEIRPLEFVQYRLDGTGLHREMDLSHYFLALKSDPSNVEEWKFLTKDDVINFNGLGSIELETKFHNYYLIPKSHMCKLDFEKMHNGDRQILEELYGVRIYTNYGTINYRIGNLTYKDSRNKPLVYDGIIDFEHPRGLIIDTVDSETFSVSGFVNDIVKIKIMQSKDYLVDSLGLNSGYHYFRHRKIHTSTRDDLRVSIEHWDSGAGLNDHWEYMTEDDITKFMHKNRDADNIEEFFSRTYTKDDVKSYRKKFLNHRVKTLKRRIKILAERRIEKYKKAIRQLRVRILEAFYERVRKH